MDPVFISTIGLTLSFYTCFVRAEQELIQLCEPDIIFNFIELCFNISHRDFLRGLGLQARSLQWDANGMQRKLENNYVPESNYLQQILNEEYIQSAKRSG
ncbi:uncharacterized protein [Scyliorhinus torazame]|uniref:uncharacterized protein isoform X2 n=1 Tax=Scyliorhinus torazame TaxID=75743 RepID=UPI003B5CBE37